MPERRPFDGPYEGRNLDRIAFPLGGIGAGMFCLEGCGALSGHWYARALASYGLLQGLTGIRYDAVEKVLHVRPGIAGDFRSFLCTATGYGTAGVAGGSPFLDVVQGEIEVDRIDYVAAAEAGS